MNITEYLNNINLPSYVWTLLIISIILIIFFKRNDIIKFIKEFFIHLLAYGLVFLILFIILTNKTENFFKVLLN